MGQISMPGTGNVNTRFVMLSGLGEPKSSFLEYFPPTLFPLGFFLKANRVLTIYLNILCNYKT